MANISDDEYEVPLLDQRYFAAGIKRKRIQFVSSTSEAQQSTSLPTTPKVSAADKYLSIVFKQAPLAERAASAPPVESEQNGAIDSASMAHVPDLSTEHCERHGVQAAETPAVCDICHKSIASSDHTARHESSIAHQICLQHSHPPSHLDRRRKGLNILQDQGWDPDARLGLGAAGEGMLHPIKAKENPERVGLGGKLVEMKAKEKPTKLDAGKVRLKEKEGKKKAEQLRNAFYRSEEVERYLGDEQVNQSLDLGAFKRSRRK